MTKLYFLKFLLLSRVTRSGDFSPIVLLLRFRKWFAVDVLGFQIELCCRYFWPFLNWQLFGLFFETYGHFFKSSGHPAFESKTRVKSTISNGREPKSCLGRVFN